MEAAAADTAGGGTAKVLLVGDAGRRAAEEPDVRRLVGHAPTVEALVESMLTALAFGTSGRYELEQRVGGDPVRQHQGRLRPRGSAPVGEIADHAGRRRRDETARPARCRPPSGSRRGRPHRLREPRRHRRASSRCPPSPCTPRTTRSSSSPTRRSSATGRKAARALRPTSVQFYIAPPATYPQSPRRAVRRRALQLQQHPARGVDRHPGCVGARRAAADSAPRRAAAFGAGFDPYFIPGKWPSGATH